MNNIKTWKAFTAILLCLLIVVGCLYGFGVGWKNNNTPTLPEKAETDATPVQSTQNETNETPIDGESILTLWTKDAAAKKALIEYMEAVTKEGGADYIPVENRIAVFDLDGTLFCETDPNYFDYCLLKYRVLDDPDYKDNASDFEKEVANKIKEQGAREIYAVCAHGLLSRNAVDRINNSDIKKLVITDSLPIRNLGPKVETLSVAHILADAIQRNHDGQSISGMFN